MKQFESEIDHRCVKPYILKDTLEKFSKKFTYFNIVKEGGYNVHLADVYIFLYVCQLRGEILKIIFIDRKGTLLVPYLPNQNMYDEGISWILRYTSISTITLFYVH